MTPHRTVLMLAGEASGDAWAGEVVRAMTARDPRLRFQGIGGPRMEGAGVRLMAGLDRLSVMGVAEVLGRLVFMRGLLARVKRLLRSGGVDLVLAVDFAGFNLRVLEMAHRLGVPTLYYVPPKFWAWGGWRVDVLARCARHVAVAFPFEEQPLLAAGARVTFVGHPLLDFQDEVPTREDFCAQMGLDPDRPILAIFPGSRRQELKRHLGLFISAAQQVTVRLPRTQPVLARAPTLPEAPLAPSGFPVTASGRALLRHARAALVKSGTTTLEAALAATPMVVAYRLHPLTFQVARHLVRVPHVALPNIVAGEPVVPEFIQGAASARTLADAILPLLEDGDARAGQLSRLALVRSRLGTPGAASRVADLALALLEGEG